MKKRQTKNRALMIPLKTGSHKTSNSCTRDEAIPLMSQFTGWTFRTLAECTGLEIGLSHEACISRCPSPGPIFINVLSVNSILTTVKPNAESTFLLTKAFVWKFAGNFTNFCQKIQVL